MNDKGQLGIDNTDDMGDTSGEMGDSLPVVNLGTGAIAITAGADHTCVQLDNSSFKCWGNGFKGKLGSNDTQDLGNQTGEMAQLGVLDL